MATALDSNPYELLGLTSQGAEASEADIRKAYRQASKLCHPDKVRHKSPEEKEAAGAKFLQITEALNLLVDVKARAALDDVIRAREAAEARRAGQSAKRQKLRADLDAREQAAERGRTEEDRARARLQAELQRLRQQAAQQEAARQAQARAAAVQAAAMAPQPSTTQEQLVRTLKISWDPQGGRDYTAAEIRDALGVAGPVEDVVVRTSKKQKGSALAVMASMEGAQAAVGSIAGCLASPLLVVPYRAKTTPPGSPLHNPQATGAEAQSSGSQATARGMPLPTKGLFPGAQRPSGAAASAGPSSFPAAAASGTPASSTSQSTGYQNLTFPTWPQAVTPPATSGKQGPLFPGGASTGGAFGSSSSRPPADAAPKAAAMPSFGSFQSMSMGNTNRDLEDHDLRLPQVVQYSCTSCKNVVDWGLMQPTFLRQRLQLDVEDVCILQEVNMS
ncbi:hypothetical protein WJX74_004098 [Apatococcus lobatus]|uniref:J domain-containing protein n=2 Tax=Apatococcus TaxID=904362 RepID=A0AAW1T1S5_9CHLO